MTTESLLAQFDEEMLNIYQRAHSEVGYNATLFLRMLGRL